MLRAVVRTNLKGDAETSDDFFIKKASDGFGSDGFERASDRIMGEFFAGREQV